MARIQAAWMLVLFVLLLDDPSHCNQVDSAIPQDPSEDFDIFWKLLHLMGRGKKSPAGFVGMRGKKDREESIGFPENPGMGILEDDDQDYDDPSERLKKAFVAMRGKKNPPEGFLGMRGKKERSKINSFVGMRGKREA